jgi:hypothetical protein
MTETIRKNYCDICNKQVLNFARASENNSVAIDKISYVVYYGGTHHVEVCQECSDKIMEFILKLHDPKEGKHLPGSK